MTGELLSILPLIDEINNINNNLNTAEKCLHYMFKTSTGPFINNYIHRFFPLDTERLSEKFLE